MAERNPLVDDLDRRIVQALADGLTQVEVAGRLFMGVGAVKGRLYRMRRMVDAQSNPQLIAIALRRGWIS